MSIRIGPASDDSIEFRQQSVEGDAPVLRQHTSHLLQQFSGLTVLWLDQQGPPVLPVVESQEVEALPDMADPRFLG
jgi:hypothetical protein